MGGYTATVRLEPDDAYGERNDDLLVRIDRPAEPADLAEGMQVQLSNGMTAMIAELTDETVLLDGNHPLAGEALTFDLELVEVG